MATELARQQHRGFYSLLRWRSDATRDEPRNVAVLLIDEATDFGELRAAPISALSPRLHEQGLLDAMLAGLNDRMRQAPPAREFLVRLHDALEENLVATEPRPVAVADPHAVLDDLYRAFLARRGGGGRPMTQGVVLDRVVNAYRKQGRDVHRGRYVGDFIFHAVLDPDSAPQPIEVLSFGAARKDWTPVERDAGHFLFAVEQLQLRGRAVIQPPSDEGDELASATHMRVRRWLDSREVPIQHPDELLDVQLAL